MKVLCIREDWQRKEEGDPCFGDICTVVDQNHFWGTLVYILKEYPHPGGYEAKAFAPLSEINETNFIREQIKEYT